MEMDSQIDTSPKNGPLHGVPQPLIAISTQNSTNASKILELRSPKDASRHFAKQAKQSFEMSLSR